MFSVVTLTAFNPPAFHPTHFSLRMHSLPGYPLSHGDVMCASQGAECDLAMEVEGGSSSNSVLPTPETSEEMGTWPRLVKQEWSPDEDPPGHQPLPTSSPSGMMAPPASSYPAAMRETLCFLTDCRKIPGNRSQKDPWGRWVSQWIKSTLPGLLVLWAHISPLL